MILIPLYRRQFHTSSFQQQHQNQSGIVERLGPDGVIVFTWPKQPTHSIIANAFSTETFECPDFETAFNRLLSSYGL